MSRSFVTHGLAWLALALALQAQPAASEVTLREISWEAELRSGRLTAGSIVGDAVEDRAVLVIDGDDDSARTIPLASFDDPGVTADDYAIVGHVRYRGVAGEAFLRMWHHAPDGKAYFSRSFGTSGPTRVLTGTSEWRDFELPFHLEPGSPRPERVTLELVLPGKGRVWIGEVRLVHDGPPPPSPTLPLADAPLTSTSDAQASDTPAQDEASAATAPGAWWSDRHGGRVAGVIGSLIGGWGAMIGMFAGGRRARRFVIGSMAAMVVAGGGLIIAGGYAMLRSQPAGVWYPLLLMGALAFGLGLAMKRTVVNRYEAPVSTER